MKRPFCNIDGKQYKLHYGESGCLRFPDDGREFPENYNQMFSEYNRGHRPLSDLFEFDINSGSSYSLVEGRYSKTGINNHTVTNGREPTKSFRLYLDEETKLKYNL